MRLAVLDYGSLVLDLDVLVPGDGHGQEIAIGVPGYLIETDDGRRIAVDSGLPPAFTAALEAAPRQDGYAGWLHAVQATAENLPAGQLAKLGLTPADVTHHVVTHTHFDHAGNLGAFPHATMVIQRAERALPRPISRGAAWPTGGAEQIIDGDADLCPGVRLLATPGHTPGHMSVLVDLPETGPLLLAIDAIYSAQALALDNFRAAFDAAQATASGHRVAALAHDAGARLIFGHDPAQWAELRKAPAWYT